MQRWVRVSLFAALCALSVSACGDDSGSGNNNGLNNNSDNLLCGNGVIDGLEECDDGADNSDTLADACRTSCQLAHCGDGVLDNGEPCDDGVANSDLVPDACRLDCGQPACGDGVVDIQTGETCDDGNTEGGDGCNADCIPEYCGNGFVEAGEVCDDGNFIVGDGCSAGCLSDETCGNGVIDFAVGETCDDGNAASHDACASSCTAEIPVWRKWHHGWGTRREHAAAYFTSRYHLILFGGLLYGGLAEDTWAFDNERWWRMEPWVSPSARRGHAMIYDSHRDRVVLFGGEGDQSTLADTWEFDGQTWKELTPATSPPPRLAHAMTYDPHRRRIVVFGGVDAAAGNRLNDTWEFDGQTWTQRSTPGGPPALDGAALIYDPTRRVSVLFGGQSDSGYSNETWELQPSGWVARVGLATVPPARRSAGAGFGYAPTGVTTFSIGPIIHGGLGDNGVVHNDLWVFDGTDWIQLTHLTRPTGRYGHTMTYTPPFGSITMVGGEGGLSAEPAGDANYVATEADTWIYGIGGWSKSSLVFKPSRREAAAMAWDPDRQRMVLYGGDRWFGLLEDTWEFDGKQWFAIPTPASAGVRAEAAMAYHATRQEMVLFGGRDSNTTQVGTTAVYDGATWTQTVNSSDPAARHGHAMAYDPVADVVVLFGGTTSDLTDETWEYNGTWTQVSTAHAPSAREGHRLVWDEERQRIVLFGGATAPGAFLSDTWEYDGTDWVELTTTQAPDGRHRHGMAYHALRQRVVTFGGAHGTFDQDTWEYDADGGLWWTIGTADAPSVRRDPAMVFNPERRGVMLFGGNSGSWWDPVLNDTWFYGYDSVLPKEVCDNGVDDDTDQLVDCADPDCNGRPCGTAGGECAGGVCACAGGTTETECGDWLDNDCDGLKDCGDPDCSGDTRCEATELSCHDAFDNDGDGFWDCGDPDCQASPACAQSQCTDWLPVYCNTGEVSTTIGAAANIDSYGCLIPNLLGAESAFRFVAPWTGSFTVNMVSEGDVHRLLVLGSGTDGSCDPTGACIGISSIIGTPEVTFSGVQGQVYWFVADAVAASTQAGFAIGVTCIEP